MKDPTLVLSILKRLVLLLAGIVLCLLAPGSVGSVRADADDVPDCTPGMSIESLQQSGGCRSGSLLFRNFQYNNSGLQITPGVFVGPSNILVDATPFSVTFSTNYGLGGGFADCINPQLGGCVEEEGSIDYDVSVIGRDGRIAGLGLFGGVQGPSPFPGAGVSAVGCLGEGNAANRTNIQSDVIGGGLAAQDTLSGVCPNNPSDAVLLNADLATNADGSETVHQPRVVLFSPVSEMSLAVELFVAGGSDLTTFTNSFLFVRERKESEEQKQRR